MNAAAVVIGCDGYSSQPLTSCIRDAEAFRSTLVDLGLVVPAEVRLLTWPQIEGALLASSDEIRRALRFFFDASGDAYDRLYVYFAGHGLLFRRPGVGHAYGTAIVPGDVNVDDIRGQAYKLIDVREVLDELGDVGPREQFYFVDACRDLRVEPPASVGALNWNSRERVGPRAQSLLYAVAELGTALGVRDGLGVMTEQLLDALRGRGVALDYDYEQDRFVITSQSVRNHIHAVLSPGMRSWERCFRLPELLLRGEVEPLRVVDDPEPTELTVRVEPTSADTATRVRLRHGRGAVSDGSWPPAAFRTPVSLQPLSYWMEAESDLGDVDPAHRRVDTRVDQEVTIRILRRSGVPGAPSSPVAPEPIGMPDVQVTTSGSDAADVRAASGAPGETPRAVGYVRATAAEPITVIELQQLDPPYRTFRGIGALTGPVPAGGYRVAFRLGLDAFSATELFIGAEEDVAVAARAPLSPLVRALVPGVGRQAERVALSTRIEPIQSGVVETLLPLVGIAPFDTQRELAPAIAVDVPTAIDPEQVSWCGLSVVVALDGEDWSLPTDELLGSVMVAVDLPRSTGLPPRWLELVPGVAGTGAPRVGVAAGQSFPSSLSLAVSSPELGAIRLVSASVPRRATVVTLRIRSDGDLRVSQSLLPFPGASDRPIPYEWRLRQTQLGQQLYAAGELLTRGSEDWLRQLVLSDSPDPLLGCMALLDAARQERRPSWLFGVVRWLEYEFKELADVAVALTVALGYADTSRLDVLLERRDVPLLADGAHALADYATRVERSEPRLEETVAALRRGQPWTASWDRSEARVLLGRVREPASI